MQGVKIVNLILHEQVRTLPSGQINRIWGSSPAPYIKARVRPYVPTHTIPQGWNSVLGNVAPNVGGDHSRIVRASGLESGPHVMVK